MNERERFLRTMRYEEVDRPPFFLKDPWPDTLARWRQEGLPADKSIAEYLGLPEVRLIYAGPETGVFPRFEERIISEDCDFVVGITSEGVTYRRHKNSHAMPHHDFPIKTGRDLEAFIEERFSLDNIEERYPENWEETIARCSDENRDFISFLDGGNLYGHLRNLAGVECSSFLFYEEPELVGKFFEHVFQIAMHGLERALARTKVDYLGFGEDIAFKTSTLISPAMFRKWLFPRYKEICAYAAKRGVDITWYDSDGCLYPFMDMYLEAGINGLAPLEVAAGMDPVEVRRRYGKRVRMIGGIDKREVAKGPVAIREEIYRKKNLIKEGGYIPTIDHSIPPDISLENFRRLINTLREIYDS
jgi:uroporphyrinogen decarboxylase